MIWDRIGSGIVEVNWIKRKITNWIYRPSNFYVHRRILCFRARSSISKLGTSKKNKTIKLILPFVALTPISNVIKTFVAVVSFSLFCTAVSPHVGTRIHVHLSQAKVYRMIPKIKCASLSEGSYLSTRASSRVSTGTARHEICQSLYIIICQIYSSTRGLYCKSSGGSLNLHLVRHTNFNVWSFPSISSLHKMSTSLYFSRLLNNFFAINFFRCVIVACAEHRMNFRFKCFKLPELHSRQMLTCSSVLW